MISKKGRMFVRAVKFKDHTHINTQQDERYEHMNHTGTVTWIHIQSFVCNLCRLPVCGHSTTLQSIRIKWGETYWTTNRIETKFPFACRQFAVVPFLAEWKPLSFTENLCAVPTLFSAIHLHAAVVVHRISLLNDAHGKSMNLLETEQRELQSIDKQPISGSRENRSRISRLTRYIFSGDVGSLACFALAFSFSSIAVRMLFLLHSSNHHLHFSLPFNILVESRVRAFDRLSNGWKLSL